MNLSPTSCPSVSDKYVKGLCTNAIHCTDKYVKGLSLKSLLRTLTASAVTCLTFEIMSRIWIYHINKIEISNSIGLSRSVESIRDFSKRLFHRPIPWKGLFLRQREVALVRFPSPAARGSGSLNQGAPDYHQLLLSAETVWVFFVVILAKKRLILVQSLVIARL